MGEFGHLLPKGTKLQYNRAFPSAGTLKRKLSMALGAERSRRTRASKGLKTSQLAITLRNRRIKIV